jgi:hypothetical protein
MVARLAKSKRFMLRVGVLAAAIAAAVVVTGLPAQAQGYYSYPPYYGPYSGAPCQTYWYRGVQYNTCNPSNRYYNRNNRYYNRPYSQPYHNAPYYNRPYYNRPYYNPPYYYNPYTSDPGYYYGGGSVIDDGPGEGGAGQR